jgi:hypothetical protein
MDKENLDRQIDGWIMENYSGIKKNEIVICRKMNAAVEHHAE